MVSVSARAPFTLNEAEQLPQASNASGSGGGVNLSRRPPVLTMTAARSLNTQSRHSSCSGSRSSSRRPELRSQSNSTISAPRSASSVHGSGSASDNRVRGPEPSEWFAESESEFSIEEEVGLLSPYIGNSDVSRSQTRRLQVRMYKRRPRIPKIQFIHRLTCEGLLSTGMPNQLSPHLQRRHQNIQSFESNDSQTRFTYAPTLSILLIPTLLAHYDYSSCLYLHPYLHADATLSYRGLYPDPFLGPKYRLRIIRRSLLSLTPFSSPLLIHGISPSL